MKNHTPSDAWIHRLIIVLASSVTVSAVGAVITVAILDQPVPEIVIALGVVVTTGLVRLLVPILILR